MKKKPRYIVLEGKDKYNFLYDALLAQGYSQEDIIAMLKTIDLRKKSYYKDKAPEKKK